MTTKKTTLTTEMTTLTAKSLIELLAESHEVARHFALLVIEVALETLPKVDDVGGIANISVGGFKPIDVIVDHVDSDFRGASMPSCAITASRSARSVRRMVRPAWSAASPARIGSGSSATATASRISPSTPGPS